MKKYPRPLRITHHKIDLRPKKRYLSDADVKKLLSGKVYVEEKIDGSQCGIGVKGGKPIVYTKNQHLFEYDKRASFNGLWDWVWTNLDKVMKITKGLRVCGEWMRVQHHIHYDQLPDWFVAFDILNERDGTLLPYKQKFELLTHWGFAYVPLLSSLLCTKDDIYILAHCRSEFSSSANIEGVVVKRDNFPFCGKLVVREFLDDIIDEDHHWTSKSTQKFNQCRETMVYQKEMRF